MSFLSTRKPHLMKGIALCHKNPNILKRNSMFIKSPLQSGGPNTIKTVRPETVSRSSSRKVIETQIPDNGRPRKSFCSLPKYRQYRQSASEPTNTAWSMNTLKNPQPSDPVVSRRGARLSVRRRAFFLHSQAACATTAEPT